MLSSCACFYSCRPGQVLAGQVQPGARDGRRDRVADLHLRTVTRAVPARLGYRHGLPGDLAQPAAHRRPSTRAPRQATGSSSSITPAW